MTDDKICGYEATTTGHPCQHPAGSCPVPSHRGDTDGGNPQGRPRKPPNMEQQEEIAQTLEAGGSISEAANRAGVHREQIRRWLNYAAEEDAGPFEDFRDRFARAKGHSQRQYREVIFEIARETGDTATLLSMLKQRHPDAWGDVNRGEQSGGVVVQLGEAEEYEIDPETLEIIE